MVQLNFFSCLDSQDPPSKASRFEQSVTIIQSVTQRSLWAPFETTRTVSIPKHIRRLSVMLLVHRTYKQLETVPKAVPVSHFGRVTVLFQGTWVSMLTYAWSSSLQSNHLPQTSSPATLGRKRHALYNVSIINVSTAPISRTYLIFSIFPIHKIMY